MADERDQLIPSIYPPSASGWRCQFKRDGTWLLFVGNKGRFRARMEKSGNVRPEIAAGLRALEHPNQLHRIRSFFEMEYDGTRMKLFLSSRTHAPVTIAFNQAPPVELRRALRDIFVLHQEAGITQAAHRKQASEHAKGLNAARKRGGKTKFRKRETPNDGASLQGEV